MTLLSAGTGKYQCTTVQQSKLNSFDLKVNDKFKQSNLSNLTNVMSPYNLWSFEKVLYIQSSFDQLYLIQIRGDRPDPHLNRSD